MNIVEIQFSDERGSTTVIKEFDECHISHYVDSFVSALLADGFGQKAINRYIPEFDVGVENDTLWEAMKDFENEGY